VRVAKRKRRIYVCRLPLGSLSLPYIRKDNGLSDFRHLCHSAWSEAEAQNLCVPFTSWVVVVTLYKEEQRDVGLRHLCHSACSKANAQNLCVPFTSLPFFPFWLKRGGGEADGVFKSRLPICLCRGRYLR
jgi:hypothetical protein